MKLTCLQSIALAALTVVPAGRVAYGEETPQVIILKLDDVVSYRSAEGMPVSPRWQRITDFLQTSKIKGSFGIIGFSLEKDDPVYFNWIKDVSGTSRAPKRLERPAVGRFSRDHQVPPVEGLHLHDPVRVPGHGSRRPMSCENRLFSGPLATALCG